MPGLPRDHTVPAAKRYQAWEPANEGLPDGPRP